MRRHVHEDRKNGNTVYATHIDAYVTHMHTCNTTSSQVPPQKVPALRTGGQWS